MSLPRALGEQAVACRALGSAFTAHVLECLIDVLRPGPPLHERLLNWPGDLGPRGHSVPLRLAGTLHGLVLAGNAPELAALYPPHPSPAHMTLRQALEQALDVHAAQIGRWLDTPPQTNEVGRSAILIASGHWLSAHYGLPLMLSELGASAGLNLMWDHYALAIGPRHFGPDRPALTLSPDWQGPLPPQTHPQIRNRQGVDLAPINPQDPTQALRLQAYVWPDQPERLARLRAAISMADAPVARADAADWLEDRLAIPHDGTLHLIYHTIAWQYFPPAVQARAQALIEAAGARATPSAPLAWLGMEADQSPDGAALNLRLWPGHHKITLGRADFHGRWVRWTAPESINTRTKEDPR